MQSKQAFTLIELLVVVLIIGILSAVALPQYQKVVEKSKSAQALSLLKTVYNAAEAYYMANGTHATSFDEISVDIPWTGSTRWATTGIPPARSNEDWSLQLYNATTGTLPGVAAGRLQGKYKGAGFLIYLQAAQTSHSPKGVPLCVERFSGGVSFTGTAGDYCQKIFNGTLLSNGTQFRSYTLP